MATFGRATFNAAAYLQHRPTYPSWVWQLVTEYHATGRIDPAQLTKGVEATSGRSSSGGGASRIDGVRWDRAIDLGCGPGISTLALLPYFSAAIGIDPSEAMISKAVRDPHDASVPPSLQPRTLAPGSAEAERLGCPTHGSLGKLDYLQDSAMTLEHYQRAFADAETGTADGSADLILAAQSSHWLTPYSSLVPLLHRILRPRGTLLLLGYSEFFLPAYPALSPLIARYSAGQPPPHDDDAVGQYWERPGRTIVDEGLTAIPMPWDAHAGLPSQDAAQWDRASAQRRVFSTQGLARQQWDSHWAVQPGDADAQGEAADLSMSKRMTWDTFAGYLSTWSSYRAYLDAHPDDAAQHGGAERADIAQRFLRRIQEGMRKADPKGQLPSEFEVRWPLHVYAVKKR